MRIAVFIKPVQTSYFDNLRNKEKYEFFMNYPDKCALVEAIKLVRYYGGEVNVFSIANEKAIDVLKEALALGANSAVLISDPIFEDLDTLSKAKVAIAAIRKSKAYDVIMFGDVSVDSMNGQMGIIVADKLGLPHISNVVRLWNEDSKIVCEKRVEDKILICEARVPVVVVVTIDLNPFELYNIAYEEIEKVNKPILKWDAKFLGIKPEELSKKIKISSINKIEQQRERKIIYFNDYNELSEKILEIFEKSAK
ncbi:MAG: hypothetical protein RXR31_03895 [Thermoproteota archaeon]|jgi:electron transfer flavoprotein beta subunit